MPKGGFGKPGSNEDYENIQDEFNFGSEKRFLNEAVSRGFDRMYAKRWWDMQHPPEDAKKKQLSEQRAKYSQPVFSSKRGGWQFDTVVPSKKHRKRGEQYQLFFINNNTKEIKSYPIPNKGSDGVAEGLQKFLQETDNVTSLTSDRDSAYITDKVLKIIADKDIDYRTTLRENHHVLGVLNRGVHTIRHKGWVFSTRKKNKGKSYFKDENWQTLVKAYNKERHGETHMKPQDMANDEMAEVKYIARKMNESDFKREESMKGIQPGKFVRVFEDPNMSKAPKNNKNLEPFTYKVHEVEGSNVWLKGEKENAYRRVPRYLVLTDPNKVQEYNLDPDIERAEDDVDSVSDYDYKDGSYAVHFKDGSSRRMTWRQLREGRPLQQTIAEDKYWNDILENKTKTQRMRTRKDNTQLSNTIVSKPKSIESKDELSIWKTYDKMKENNEI